jgi:hypothetical protein
VAMGIDAAIDLTVGVRALKSERIHRDLRCCRAHPRAKLVE